MKISDRHKLTLQFFAFFGLLLCAISLVSFVYLFIAIGLLSFGLVYALLLIIACLFI